MRVLIIGGGIAGPTLGMFLQRVGIEAEICEARTSALPDEGAFMGVAPNGMHVLRQLDLAPTIESRGERSLGFSFQNSRGEAIGTIDNRADWPALGEALVMIKRGVLQGALLAAANQAGVPLRLGKKLMAVEQGAEGVAAYFEDGSESRADLLIGCDGVHSHTRKLVLPDAPEPAYYGLVGMGGFVPATSGDPLERGWNTMMFGKRAFFGAFLGTGNEVWWFHNAGAPRGSERLPYGKAQMLTAHRDDAPWVNALIERTSDIVGPWPQYDIARLPHWHRGRVCLIGDAAHATTPSGGQGASLALEDALLLARCLRDQGHPTHAFATFEALRRQRVEWIVKQSRRNGSNKAPGAAGAWFRDRMLSTFLKLGASAQRTAYAYKAELQ